MELKGKKIVVTGASGGMGKILTAKLAEAGACLALCSNDGEALKALVSSLGESSATVVLVRELDITSETEVADFFAAAAAKMGGKIDALVNLAGLSIPGQIAQTEEKMFDTTMDVNLKGAFFAAKYYLASAAEDGQIINIGSMAARRANGNAPLYCTAKAAVNMFSDALAIQAAKQGVRVSVLNPGGADTPFWGDRPVNRAKLMQASDVVEMMLFLLRVSPAVVVHSIDFESLAAMQ